MSISENDVRYIANLARLQLQEKELVHFQEQLETILGYVGKLEDLDIEGVQPLAHILDLSNVFRKDTPKPSLGPQDLLQTAPAREGNFFKVPKVIE